LAAPEASPPELLPVTCPVCHELMRVELTIEPQSVSCPFCESRVPVPSLEQARRERAARGPLPVPVVEEYAIAESAGAAPPKPASRLSRPERGDADDESTSAFVKLECPTCHELINARVETTPGSAPCPFCETMVSVPDRKTVAGWQAAKIAPRNTEAIGEYATGAVVPTLAMRPGSVFDKLAEIRREVAPPPPRWTFFSGVFTFPWRQEVHIRWAYMTVGFTAIAIIGLVLKGIASSFSGIGSGVAVAFFMRSLA
jgi:hypothetical protein